MGLVSGTVKNLFGGVSQAPAEQRDESQFSAQENAFPVYGLKLGRRPPLLHAAKLATSNLTGAFVHQMGDYTILVQAGTVKVFETLTGIQQTVVNNVSWSYLTTGTFKAVTKGNTTYILNTTVATASGLAVATTAPFRAHVSVRTGDYETTYKVVLNGTTYSYATPAAAVAASKAATNTNAIATQLTTLLAAAPGFLATRLGSTIYIRRSDAADFTISTEDGIADNGLSLVKTTVQQFSDLPELSQAGTIAEVVGESSTATDNYFVQSYATDGFSAVANAWREVTKPGQQYVLDSLTLPVQIVKTTPLGVPTFTVDACAWDVRAAGDDTTNPFPSFIGSTLSDIFVYQGRLGFLCGEKVILSRAGHVLNFFRSSAAQILADDPIDISGSASGVTQLDWALNWNEAIYLFANGRAQYVLSGTGDLTASSIRLEQVSDYRYAAAVRPIVTGQRVFFVALKSGLPHVMDYHLKGYSKVHEATDVGLHVPTYFQGTARSLVADDAQGVLLFLTSTGLYCYNYRMDEESHRTQGAWNTWTFKSGTVLALDLSNGVVSLVQGYGDGTYLNLILLDPARLLIYEGFDLFVGSADFDGIDLFDGGGGAINTVLAAYLDRYVATDGHSLSAIFDGVNTVWTLPYAVAVDGSEGIVGVTGANPGVLLTTTRPSTTTVSAVGDYTGDTTRAGILYTTAHTLSTLYVRNRNTGEAETRGRLQLRWLRVHYVDVTSLTVTVSTPGRADRIYTTTFAYPQTGSALIPIQSRTEDSTIVISAGTAGGDAIAALDWEGTYHARSARL